MGALRSPLPSEVPLRKPAKLSLNKYGRDPQSPSEKLRGQSDYDKESGYAPLFHSMLADWPRISRGHAADILMMIVLSKSLGRAAKKGEPRQQSTPAMSMQELAQLCRCDVRTIQRELKDFETRGIATVEDAKRGQVIITLLYRGWEALSDYKPEVIDISTGEEVEEEEAEEAKDSQPTQITKKPVKVKAGGTSKPLPVNCGVKTLRYEITGPVDVEFSAVVQKGELLVTSRVSDEWLERAQKENARSNQINNLNSPARHGCRDEKAKVTHQPAITKKRTQGEIHPRAVEICSLFDPLLAKWQTRLLSLDPVALKSACDAIGDTPGNYLIEFLNKGKSPRAAREIKSPAHVAAICKEAKGNWQKHGTIPVAPETPEEEGKRKFRELITRREPHGR